MGRQRRLQLVPGKPEEIVGRAAARLAYLGDQVEAISATEFVWRPQPAERRLFRCPRAVTVRAVESDSPGQSALLLEWRGGLGLEWLWTVPLAGVAVLLTWLLAGQGTDGFRLVAGVCGSAACLLAPRLLDSGWLSRLQGVCTTGHTRAFDLVPEAGQYLTLSPDDRAAVVAELRRVSPTISEAGARFSNVDRRSGVELLGWPLWQVAWGRDAVIGSSRVARAWYARGQLAQGLVAVGQKANGWLAIGQLAIGLVAVGQAAVGVLVGLGQLAIAGLLAIGQAAVGLVSLGMVALGLLMASLVPTPFSDLSRAFLLCLAIGVPASGVLFWLAAKLGLSRAEEQAVEASLARRLEATPHADEASLSRARLTGDAERGLSASAADLVSQAEDA
ncbi:MAG: hypothetical protein IT204_24850 [Fimbriimonadaceae bacterium]|nr:hypothetical protein [Fimbriimonadaceae bacterium]